MSIGSKSHPLNVEACWRAVLEKDKAQDGCFFYAVVTTGVYCRPSCPARRPLRKNVRFYGTPVEAERDGFKACLRCRPAAAVTDRHAARMTALCEYIRQQSAAGESVALRELSRQAGLSSFHLQRTFKAVVGITPKQFAEACKMNALKKQLRSADTVTEAIYDAGFNSSSRVYERIDSRLGLIPASYRAGGENVSISYACAQTPMGLLIIAATDRGLCFVQFGESEQQLLAMLRNEYPRAMLERTREPYPEQFHFWMRSLLAYLSGERTDINLPADIRATAFQQKIWNYLQSIPYGVTKSYSEVAAATGNARAVRAVARACAANPVAILIPCHRVIRGDGDLGGYRSGLARKRALLDTERSHTASAGT